MTMWLVLREQIEIEEKDLEAFAWAADELLFPHVSSACLDFIDDSVQYKNLTTYLNL